MKFKILGSAVLATGLMMSSAMAQTAEHGKAHWEYAGKHGPSHWGEMESDFSSCKLGKAQSPIDIHAAKAAALTPIDFQYAPSAGEIVNNGHTVQVNLNDAGSVKLPSGGYKLLQFHFHTPSEESINGKHYPLVAHLVHKNENGDLAVVAVLFKKGKENAALKQVFAELPPTAGEKHPLAENIDIMATLPAKRAYYAFMGSLTTPPCSEGVHWQVLKQPAEISGKQLAAFRKLYAMNARPIQPLNGRVVGSGG
jgi:carbonic anhydrase